MCRALSGRVTSRVRSPCAHTSGQSQGAPERLARTDVTRVAGVQYALLRRCLTICRGLPTNTFDFMSGVNGQASRREGAKKCDHVDWRPLRVGVLFAWSQQSWEAIFRLNRSTNLPIVLCLTACSTLPSALAWVGLTAPCVDCQPDRLTMKNGLYLSPRTKVDVPSTTCCRVCSSGADSDGVDLCMYRFVRSGNIFVGCRQKRTPRNR